MRPRRGPAFALLLVLLPTGCRGQEPPAATPAPHGSGMRVYVDEEGNFAPPPPDASPPAAAGSRAVPKTPVWEPAPGGGDMIRLEDRGRKHSGTEGVGP